MYKIFPDFIFRSPLLSYNYFKTISKNKGSLLQALDNSEIQEAIFIASPILYKELQKLIKNEIKEESEIQRILYSCTRYLSRMSTRCTPFGLFAGCGVGKTGDTTYIEQDKTINRATRIDMYYLCTLYDTLVRKDEIKNKIKYFSNSSLYLVGKRIRYVETTYTQNRRKYQIAEVDRTSYLCSIIKKADKGVLLSELIQSLTNEYISKDEASNYIDELINSQLLVGELSNSIIGEDFLFRIILMLERIEYSGSELSLLIQINELLKKLDNNAFEKKNIIYQKIIELIKQINIPYEEKFLFQVDMTRGVLTATLGQPVIQELQKTMKFLNKITPPSKNETIKKFQEYFYNRYEDMEVSLMEALDPETGIGYPPENKNGDICPLVDNFIIPSRHSSIPNFTDSFTSLLIKKTIECLSERSKEIIFKDDDVKNLEAEWDDLPPTIYTMCEVLNANQDEILIKASYFGGSCGANLLGRFAYANRDIEILTKDIVQKEGELTTNVILAEILHLPESRTGNILSRPHLRDYELSYLSYSDLPATQLLQMSDLMLSVRSGRLIIRSKKLNKEIVPRLTTAHNYRNQSMPVYQFLCEMQHINGRNGLYFRWGQLEDQLDFRPRVRYNNTILSPASWTVRIKNIDYLLKVEDDINLISQITHWRNSISLPQETLMPDGDNEMYVDWQNPLSVRSLFSIIKKRQIVHFEEFLFNPDNPLIIDKNSSYTNEIIVVFHK
uniref:lantibiotic dehydratase family protein n=1 Tax=uncultured Dysgonomonas sp. TaxID=206096 RepID=UPI002633DF75|nr:lantibiotic dehydratase family protein [uncultured Dysgonomonas sp.]